MNSANARDCLLHLARAKLSEREDLVRLNDQLVDIIESVHFMEAEHAALEHDYNLLKTGVQSDSSGINEIYEVEIRNVRAGVEDINRNRQQLLHEQSTLSQQVKEVEQQWRHTAQAAFGVPKEVDEEFARICQIKYENCITLKRTKYMEEKNRLTKQNNGRIFEQINLMRMRKDQAVSLQQEYLLRKNELLNSIRNLEEDNKRIIMNEHKYFTRDRTADRHVFRDQLRQAINDIRADYEFKRLRNEEEIRVRLEREMQRINSNPTVSITWDRLKDELSVVKTNCASLQQQVSNVEIRNATLTQQIELLRLEISENNQSFEISLESKIKEIEKLREQCTSISVELEKLCDLNIDLEKEIAVYRRLLDGSGNVTTHTGSVGSLARNLNHHSTQFINERTIDRRESTILDSSRRTSQSVPPPTHRYPPIQPLAPVSTIHESRENIYTAPHSPYQRTYSPYQRESRSASSSRISVIDTHSERYPAVPLPPAPTIPLPPTPVPAVSVIPLSTAPIPAARSSGHYEYSSSTLQRRQESSGPLYTTQTTGIGSGVGIRGDIGSGIGIRSEIGSGIGSGVGIENRRTYSAYDTPYTPARIETPARVETPRRVEETHYDTIHTRPASEYTRVSPSFPPIKPISETIKTGYEAYKFRGSGSHVGSHVGTHGIQVDTHVGSHVGSHTHGTHTSAHGAHHSTHGTHVSHTHGNQHSVSSSTGGHIKIDHYSPPRRPSPFPETTKPYNGGIEESSSFDSVDEDNFQRFTRWYKGRVKISDVTPDYVQLVNRSSKKSADIGGFRLIHEFGNRSVFVDLPVGLILKPKECLKIYARSAHYERGAVVAEIDFFDTTIHTNTSIRNTNNEVKSWFVYTSNTEIADGESHQHN
ncbi:unnamed protein product [Caenorhabditis nigoni]